MPSLDAASNATFNPQLYKGTLLGTAAGTITISNRPGIFGGVWFPNRVAGSSVVIFDSAGTSGTVLGTVTLGTQTFSDPVHPYILNVATQNGLTVANDAGVSVLVLYL